MTAKAAREALRLIHNPPNPWHHGVVEHVGPPPLAVLELFEDRTRSALSKNDSPDLGFAFSVNPYRGCYHGCAYCYARPSHEHLDFGAGTDFERKLVYKPDIAALLRAAFDKPSWRGDLIAFSGNTDCYQPLEASLGLTRACLKVCLEYKNPVSIITKSALVERDVELLADLAREAHCTVHLSIPFDDEAQARALEPHAPSPARRYKAIERLAKGGVPVGVMVAPIIPGLSDSQVPTILKRARDAGATFTGRSLLRLPGPVEEVFVHRLSLALPHRAERVMSALRECRGGKLDEGRFGRRMVGVGERWKAIDELAEAHARRLGYQRPPQLPDPTPFRRPHKGAKQLALW
ncbi:MAG: PA0069 family radical SAM protein [Deltaproteobacteria bacterium]|nr:MAG: PA0069 family radical SAM protein [Deltaproteobacteria bacterium]